MTDPVNIENLIQEDDISEVEIFEDVIGNKLTSNMELVLKSFSSEVKHAESSADFQFEGVAKSEIVATSTPEVHIDWVDPPYPEASLFNVLEFNHIHRRCIQLKAQDAFGQGYDLEPTSTGDDENTKLKEALLYRLEHLNPQNESIYEIDIKVGEDLNTFSRGAIEVTRNMMGELPLDRTDEGGIYYLAVNRLRPHKRAFSYGYPTYYPVFKYINNDGSAKYLKAFGAEGDYDKNTGMRKDGIPWEDRANEVVYIRRFYPRLYPFYGLPILIYTYAITYGFDKVLLYNDSFFASMGGVKKIVYSKGGMAKKDHKKTKAFIQTQGQGPKQKAMYAGVKGDGEFKVVDLEDKPEEGHFSKFGVLCQNGIILGYGIPAYRLGEMITGALAGNIAKEATGIYDDSVLDPDRNIMSAAWDKVIQSEYGFNVPGYKIKYKNLDTKDQEFELKKYNEAFDRGVVTIAQYGKAMGVAHFEDNDPIGLLRFMKTGYTPLLPGTQEAMMLQSTTAADTKGIIEKIKKSLR